MAATFWDGRVGLPRERKRVSTPDVRQVPPTESDGQPGLGLAIRFGVERSPTYAILAPLTPGRRPWTFVLDHHRIVHN